MRCRSWVAFASFVAWLLAAPSVVANGRFPVAGQVVFDPSDSSFIAVRLTVGVIVSHDSGKNWDWICEKAMGYGTFTEDPTLAITAGSALLVGTQEALARSTDGCGWTFPSVVAPIVDLVVRGDDPRGALALVAVQGAVDDAGNAAYQNILYATTGGGATWSVIGSPLDAGLMVQTVEIAKSDPARIYVSATRSRADGADAVILTSRSNGAQFTEHTFPLSATEVAPFVAAVDPTNADRVYVRVQSLGGATRLVVSDDGATTFHDVFTTKGPMLGFALSQDGATAYLGGLDDGLYTASRTDLLFTQKSQMKVLCLATRGALLYACSNERSASGFALGASADDGSTFTPLLRLACLRGAITCDVDARAAACAAEFPALQQTVGACVSAPGDGGTADAAPSDAGSQTDGSVGAAGGPPSDTAHGPDGGLDDGAGDISIRGGCTTGGTRGSLTVAAIAALALLGTRRRRPRRNGPRG